MKTLYQITYRAKNGLRTLLQQNGRNMHETPAAASTLLRALLAVNDSERLASIYGAQAIGTFRVDPVQCYDHGDAVGIYIDEGDVS